MYIHRHVRIHIHIHIRTCTCTYVRTYMHMRICTYVHTYMHMHIHVHTSTHKNAHMYTHTHIPTCACTRAQPHLQYWMVVLHSPEGLSAPTRPQWWWLLPLPSMLRSHRRPQGGDSQSYCPPLPARLEEGEWEEWEDICYLQWEGRRGSGQWIQLDHVVPGLTSFH